MANKTLVLVFGGQGPSTDTSNEYGNFNFVKSVDDFVRKKIKCFLIKLKVFNQIQKLKFSSKQNLIL